MVGATRCPNCGTEAVQGQRFCRNCGTDLSASAGAWPAAPASEQTAPMIPAPPPEPVGAASAPGANIPWPAWLGVAALAVVALGSALEWIAAGPLSANGFDVAFGALFSDTAQGGISIAVVLVILVAIGFAVALLMPEAKPMAIAFIAVGALCALIMVWYLVKALTSESAPGVTLTSFGVWIAMLGAFAVAAAGVFLQAWLRDLP